MPIRLPNSLPAFDLLKQEGVMVLDESSASRQDIRPLRIALLNLMPHKIETENQFARLIGATPLQIELTLVKMSEHQTKTTAASHMAEFYRPFQDVKAEKFDGLIITGAPIEHLDFQDVTYWDELTEIFEWTQTHIHSTLAVCWGAMAMVHYFHNVPKHTLEHKAFGCFRHSNCAPTSPYLRGFSDDCVIPVSRWTEVRQTDVDRVKDLSTLITSPQTGPAVIDDRSHRALYIFNHFEYDDGTLKGEYDRDIENGQSINVPENYYPNDDPTQPPLNRWRSHAHLFYGNWVNEIYQSTPYGLNDIGA